ncbi:right-handed parallel beta-helix repeat-containing protein [Bacillus sp. BRMEA1]|uniref:right-handed parallel beta-helix repeat-containing protein n=1 Tax=Neobacillus endophyticus TaxID=2738405 RepID=UPI0015654A9C|nr:right-handed parallel beta-helix repeat-containing protein [Neobacillus endophyticus]NRD79075.1 right-handed parallel beta-helix repeat-containing protein [Neobacillus endophyticus]
MGKKIFVLCGQSINAAIAIANPGDAIIVEDCVYHENVVVNKNDIRLVAAHPHGAILDGTGAPGIGILITASGVEVNGFVIRNYSGDGILVLSSSVSDRLINNNIHNIGLNGVEIQTPQGEHLIWKNNIKDIVSNGIFSTGFGCCNAYIQNEVERVGGFGISTGCCSFIHQNEVENTGNIAIDAHSCCNAITENKVMHSGNIGISATGCCSPVVSNQVENSGSDGIFAIDFDNFVVDNHVKHSLGTGIRADFSGDDIFYGNTVSDSGINGIDGGIFGFDTMIGNHVEKSRGIGINVLGIFNNAVGNTVLKNQDGIAINPGIGIPNVDNWILQNEVERNSVDGIFINAANDRTVVAENEVEKNNVNGIHVFSSFDNIENNEIENNSIGINIEPSAVDTFVARNELEDNDKNVVNNGVNTIFFQNEKD